MGQTLLSPSQIFELGFFSPNNTANRQFIGIWYKEISPRKFIWVANGENPLQLADSNASLTIGSNGNLELLDGNKKSVWSTNITGASNRSVAVLADNGNFLLKDGTSGDELWQSFQHPGDTFVPGAVLGFNAKTGVRDRLTSWRTDTDPSLGNFFAELASQRPPEGFIWINGSTRYWRSGPWDKSRFAGIVDMGTLYQNPFNLVEDAEKGTTDLYFNSYSNFTISFLVLSSEGVLKLVGKDKGSDWYIDWEAPTNQCEIYGTCGPFGVCKESESPICECLKGFVPKSIQEWRKGNWTGGCVRRSQLLCEKTSSSPSSKDGKKDGFWKIESIKLPDYYELVELDDYNADSCEAWCLNNCSCLAYA
ncbi:hypothetical protein TIFTF001_020122 [Ficus carica]|uniref:Uncharacterized protein n=1 Tax=Ficus carica TaxID=3494 RepID=A0AA88AFG9_FICCA|nr:hypothetical protein TIFTF001_020122 [Ficus carica]